MRTVLGRVASVGIAAAALAAGTTAVSASPPSTATETTAATSTSTSTTTTTTVPAGTTTEPELVVDVPTEAGRATPSRGTQIQLTPTDPPPPTAPPVPPHLRLPENSGEGRRIVYHKSRQRVWVVEANGGVSKTHAVSGKLATLSPPAGHYQVFSRSKYTCNIKNQNICWRFMVRFAKGPRGDNIGFHEIPIDKRTGAAVQSVSQLGQPLSGGCVRQATPDAIFIWEWAPVGTPVVVIQ